ncbi:MAG: Na+/H+ antiporter NhaA [Fimbriimonadaceae bacterium]|nr:MAG: Na+/H+ antiporter NhaA [Fimbriimonadaceae bacterium]
MKIPKLRKIRAVVNYIRVEAMSGVVLIAAALIAVLWKNSPLAEIYDAIIHYHLNLNFLGSAYDLTAHFFVNDILMAIFFLVVGMEIKREVLSGELSSAKKAVLPAIAAIGGVAVPAIIYVLINRQAGGEMRGWAIPTATDIAFSLAIVSLFGNRIPFSLRVFLTALAIIDDLMAVLAIAFFYTASISVMHLAFAGILLAGLVVLNRMRVTHLAFYLIPGILLFYFVYKSGIHATIAGVLLAMVIPMRGKENQESPLVSLENALHPWVANGILPVFAFFNSGIALGSFTGAMVMHPVTIGCFAGLFFGKQIGVMVVTWIAVRFKVADLPSGATWLQFYALSILTGLGFTMSLFIGALAFGRSESAELAKFGVMAGSLLSALVAIAIFAVSQNKSKSNEDSTDPGAMQAT